MTHYPRSGRGRRWAVIELKAISRDWRGDSLADGDGMVGTVRQGENDAVTVQWCYAFKPDGRVAWHYCGTWPVTSLEAVRAARDEARSTLKRRVDPNLKREADRITERDRLQATIAADSARRAEDATVEQMVRAWLRAVVLRKDGNAGLRRIFENDVPTFDLSNIRSRTLSADEIRELRDIFRGMATAFENAADKRTAARPVQPETQCAL